MSILKNKKILLGVSGSIAAYKAPQLVRLLVKSGAIVKVVITKSSKDFVSELALSTVSLHPVLSEVSDGAQWNNHVALSHWADVMLIAPASANTIAKLSNGLCDNILTALYLSAKCPVIIAPAMDEDMWHHPATQHNIQKLKQFGKMIIPVGHGELASGLVGAGRLAELEDIHQYLEDFFNTERLPLKGKKCLISAGPTYEKIDPVRFIGNYSTGKMGIAIADVLAKYGASVKLVLGPTHLRPTNSTVEIITVESADEMYDQCMTIFPETDIAIMSAAVSDYKVANKATQKIKKSNQALKIELSLNKDILASLGALKKSTQTLVGFALETENELENARKKLETKKADYIILNSLNDQGAGFGGDTNKVTIVSKGKTNMELPLMTKKEVAAAIIEHIFLK